MSQTPRSQAAKPGAWIIKHPNGTYYAGGFVPVFGATRRKARRFAVYSYAVSELGHWAFVGCKIIPVPC